MSLVTPHTHTDDRRDGQPNRTSHLSPVTARNGCTWSDGQDRQDRQDRQKTDQTQTTALTSIRSLAPTCTTSPSQPPFVNLQPSSIVLFPLERELISPFSPTLRRTRAHAQHVHDSPSLPSAHSSFLPSFLHSLIHSFTHSLLQYSSSLRLDLDLLRSAPFSLPFALSLTYSRSRSCSSPSCPSCSCWWSWWSWWSWWWWWWWWPRCRSPSWPRLCLRLSRSG